MLYPDGTVTFVFRRSVRFICKFTFNLLPFDDHTCNIKVFVINSDSNSVVMKINEQDKKAVVSPTSRGRNFDENSGKFDITFNYFQ